jgi:hypothetical protein
VGIIELPRQLLLLCAGDTLRGVAVEALVRALGLNVAGLLALVADLLTACRFLGAVAGVVTGFTTVVALHAVDTFAYSSGQLSFHTARGEGVRTRHVAVATAGVARLTGATGAATAEAAVAATAIATTKAASLGAVASDVTHLTTLSVLVIVYIFQGKRRAVRTL